MLPPDGGKGDDCALDAVIVVKRPSGLSRKLANRTQSDSPNSKKATGGNKGSSRSCRCQHGDRIRQRHNATQTPDSILSCNQLHTCHSHSAALDCCDNKKSNSCCGLINGDLKTGEITCHCHITHHCHRYSPGSGVVGSGDGREKRKSCELRGHSSQTYQQRHNYQRHHHHHHHKIYNPHHHHHHYRHLQPEFQTENTNFNIRQLPGYNSKSSYDSSDDLQQSGLDAHQEIAIEIDAATMTEGNTSTATSNFAYKMAMGNIVPPIIMAPLHDNCEDGRKYRQKRPCRRCDSINSNSTVETDELSRCNHVEGNDEEGATNSSLINGSKKNAHHSLWGSRDINDLCNTNTRTELTKTDNNGRLEKDISSQRLVCCDDSMCCISTAGDMNKRNATAHNECVKIQRKLFKASAADDCCSTCSHCTNCSCQNADATSCSSFDDLDADEDYEERRMASHELVVAAECHRCNFYHRSTSSTGEEAEDGDCGVDKEEELRMNTERQKQPRRILRNDNNTTTDSSAHTSRRSSASYCSCHSSTCYCCECNCRGNADGDEDNGADDDDDDDCDTATTGQMRTARDTSCTALTSAATVDFDAEHSSTLTPLTNASSVASTPGAEEADITLRSLNNTLTEDVGSSLSQSAEYFSLSSSNQQSQISPARIPVRRSHKLHSEGSARAMVENKSNCDLVESNEEQAEATSRKPCKHYIKHHRHKRPTSPLDGYL